MGSEEIEKENNSKAGLCHTIARAAFSHIGLSIIIIAYCCIGAALFEMLEKDNEIIACAEARDEYLDMENETLFSLLDVILSNPLNSNGTDIQMLGVFESFRNNSFSIGYDGSWCEGYGKPNGPMHEWTFAGGLFFSMTVITTIGYGHISPKTQWGRIFCISYAMMGIPLMLLFLANVGDVLAEVFKYIYAKVICCGCMKSKKKKKQPLCRKNGRDPENAVGGDSNGSREPVKVGNYERVPSASSRWSGSTSSPAHESSTAWSDGKNANKRAQNTRDSMDLEPVSNDLKQRNTNNNPMNIKPLACNDISERGRKLKLNPTKSAEPLIVDDDSDYDDDEEEWEEINKIAVPLTVSLGIIGLYIIGGAVLFKYWEGWDMSQAGYFCFITLSSIGFGDVTPGRDFSDPTANAKLVMGSVYSIFGMAILSMCFTLMQEEMLAKFTWLGRKLGVVEADDDTGDDDEVEPAGNKAGTNRGTGHNANQSEC